jgi:hypothetical protein
MHYSYTKQKLNYNTTVKYNAPIIHFLDEKNLLSIHGLYYLRNKDFFLNLLKRYMAGVFILIFSKFRSHCFGISRSFQSINLGLIFESKGLGSNISIKLLSKYFVVVWGNFVNIWIIFQWIKIKRTWIHVYALRFYSYTMSFKLGSLIKIK